MKISRKIMMVSAAVLLGASPLVATNVSQTASAANYKTNSKESSVVTIKSAHFVNKNGKELPIVAEKGGSYTVWDIKTIGDKTYYNVEKGADYWLLSTVTKGRVTYIKNGATYTVSTNENTASGTVAPHSTSSTITLKHNAYIYSSNGKRQGKIYIAKGAVLANHGTKKIKGKLYYNVGDGRYVKAGNIQTETVMPHASEVSGKSTTSKSTKRVGRSDDWQPDDNTLRLKRNAIPYDENGKRRTDLGYTYIRKTTLLNYYGTKKINGTTYYYLGDGVYINGANVKSVNNKK
ncbi:SLAP domain-containing protein [Lactobacillus sp. PSON]|uniref:SLAP domain-containing protein n=1 Tax=Lactobacillus sp. PSON TaxID=3455454 RepID=UPI004042749D